MARKADIWYAGRRRSSVSGRGAKDLTMYEWLKMEISQIKTPKFHVIDGPGSTEAADTLEKIGPFLPPSHRLFLSKFGGAKLYRELDYYLLGVLASPWEEKDSDGKPIACIGHYDDANVYFKLPLSEGEELPVFESIDGGLKKVSGTFEQWIEKRCLDCKKRIGKTSWAKILKGPTPFSAEETQILEARKRFEWSVMGRTDSGDLRFKVHNGSDLTLPFLSVGVRSVDRKLNGGVYLPVSALKPGQTAIIDRDCYKNQVDPSLIEAFALPDPGPEDRDRYWEFRALGG